MILLLVFVSLSGVIQAQTNFTTSSPQENSPPGNVTTTTVTEPSTASHLISVPSTSSESTTEQQSTVISTTKASVPSEELSHESSEITPESDLGPCTCDLTLAVCDINCCCDPDCSLSDRDVFSHCQDVLSRQKQEHVCLQESIFFLNNTAFTKIDSTVPGLFCVEKDNFQDRNYYEVPTIATSSREFDKIVKRQRGRPLYSYDLDRSQELKEYSPYKFLDRLLMVDRWCNLRQIPLPDSSFSSRCFDLNPLLFLREQNTSCTRQMPANCQFDLNLTQLFSEHRIVRNPALMDQPDSVFSDDSVVCIEGNNNVTCANDSAKPTTSAIETNNKCEAFLNSTISVPFQICTHMINDQKTCLKEGDSLPQPFKNNSADLCQNFPSEIHYSIVHDVNDIVGVEVLIKFIDIPAVSRQPVIFNRYSVEFSWFNRSSAAQVYSGNPGYLTGHPLRFGRLNETKIEEQTYYNIIPVSQPLIRAVNSGSCLSDLIPRFGEDLLTTCFMELSPNEPCHVSQKQIELRLTAARQLDQLYVATFGSSAYNLPGDWLKLKVADLPSLTMGPATDKGECSLSLGLIINIYYAFAGAVWNPQARIIAANVSFSALETVSFICPLPNCVFSRPADSKQSHVTRVQLTTVVKFIDQTSPPIALIALPKLVVSRLPYDAFFPFFIGATTKPCLCFWCLNLSLSFSLLFLLLRLFCVLPMLVNCFQFS